MTKPRPPIEDKVIETADEFMSVIEDFRDALDHWNVMAGAGNGAAAWEAYLRSRAGNSKPPDAILRWLDTVAQDLLRPNLTHEQIARAVGLARPTKGGPGAAGRLAKQLETQRLCSELWLAATGGKYTPGDKPPSPMPNDVVRRVAALHGKEWRSVKTTWGRWSKKPQIAPVDIGAALFGNRR